MSSCRSGGGGCGGRSGRSGCYPVGLVRGGRGGHELVGELQNELLLWAEEVILVRAQRTTNKVEIAAERGLAFLHVLLGHLGIRMMIRRMIRRITKHAVHCLAQLVAVRKWPHSWPQSWRRCHR